MAPLSVIVSVTVVSCSWSTSTTTGSVSIVSASDAATLMLPAASKNLPSAMLTLALPLKLSCGVNVAVKAVPLPAKLLIVPPEVATSSPANRIAVLLVVNVIVEVWPLVRLTDDAVIATVGLSVSIVIFGDSSPARFASAAPLVNVAAATVTSPKPSKSCVGVNVAV